MTESGEAPEPRPAANGDLEAITEIYGHHVLHGLGSFELTAPSLEAMAERFEAIKARGLPYLVVEREGAVRGFAYAGAYRPRPAYRFAVENSVYIAPGHEGRGLGRLLLRQVIRDCTDLGYRRMVAVIGDSANHASIRLHEALGFERAGLIPSTGFKLGRWVDVVILQRALGEGDRSLPPDT